MLGHPAWISNNAESNWVGLVGQGTQSVPPGSYSFSHEFDLSDWDASTASITIQVAADNRLDDVLLNGESLGIKAPGFNRFQGPFTVNRGFLKNLNNLEFIFTNAGVDPNPSGLHVQLEGTAFPLATNSRLQDHAVAAVKILPTSTVAAIDQLYSEADRFEPDRSPLQSSNQWKESGKTDVTVETDESRKTITLDLPSLDRVFDQSGYRKEHPALSQRP